MSTTELVCIVIAAASVAVALAVSVTALRAMRSVLSEDQLEDQLDTRFEKAEGLMRTLADRQAQGASETKATLESVVRGIEGSGMRVDALRRDVNNQLSDTANAVTRQLADNARVANEQLTGVTNAVTQQLAANTKTMNDQLSNNTQVMNEQLTQIRGDNQRQLDEIRATVDERLTRTLNDRLSVSFKQINENLEAVYKGLGDMQGLAAGVGDLKKTLSNVKTRGILGEVQLGAILSEILVPSQYAENVATKPGSADRVEFAVKLPVEEGEPVWLPIDAKFPGDLYAQLRDAVDEGSREEVAAARKRLEGRICQEASDICQKYISVPETTNFAVMFLPFEGLYAEVVNMPGLIERLTRDYHVNVAGPSTMAAILSSLQMTYQTFNLQRRTNEVMHVLQAVKAELPRYQAELRKAKEQIDRAGRTVDGIITTRTNVMERKLKTVSDSLDDELPELEGELPEDV